MSLAVEAALRRQRALTLVALAILAALAWAWLVLGAGMGMPLHFDLGFLLPGNRPSGPMDGMALAPQALSAAQFLLALSMWWVMMVAMMLPAAAPVILLYARAATRPDALAPATAHFLAGYLGVWGLFSLAAAGAQAALQSWALLAPMTMDSTVRWLSVALLGAAGLYQLSPIKEACLRHCRNPASFLARHYRPGRTGALRMGAVHGAYCVGCCWLLMALLFVGGVMNLAWIALLTLLVAGEKLLPGGRVLAKVAGAGFLIWVAVLLPFA